MAARPKNLRSSWASKLLKLKLLLSLFGDPPEDPACLVASVVMPDKRGVIRRDLLCDLSPLLLKQGPKIFRLTFLGGHNERKHVGGRAAHFIHASHQHATRPRVKTGSNKLGGAIGANWER